MILRAETPTWGYNWDQAFLIARGKVIPSVLPLINWEICIETTRRNCYREGR